MNTKIDTDSIIAFLIIAVITVLLCFLVGNIITVVVVSITFLFPLFFCVIDNDNNEQEEN